MKLDNAVAIIPMLDYDVMVDDIRQADLFMRKLRQIICIDSETSDSIVYKTSHKKLLELAHELHDECFVDLDIDVETLYITDCLRCGNTKEFD